MEARSTRRRGFSGDWPSYLALQGVFGPVVGITSQPVFLTFSVPSW